MRHRDHNFDDPLVRARRWLGWAFWIVLYATVIVIVVLTVDFIDPTVWPTWLLVAINLTAAISLGWWVAMLVRWRWLNRGKRVSS